MMKLSLRNNCDSNLSMIEAHSLISRVLKFFIVSFLASLFGLPSWSASSTSITYWQQRDDKTPGVIPECRTTFIDGKGESAPIPLIAVHGFSACPVDIDPVPEKVGLRFGLPVLKVRLSGHGIRGSEGLRGVKLSDWQNDLDSVIPTFSEASNFVMMGTSTGGSLAIDFAVRHPERVKALVLLSPNLGLDRWDSELLLLPWGLAEFLAQWIVGPYRSWEPVSELHAKYWTTKYPSTALIPMMQAVNRARSNETLKLAVPTLILYCPNDNVVSAKAIENFAKNLSSSNKKLVPAPCQEDLHVLAGEILSPQATPAVIKTINEFLDPLL